MTKLFTAAFWASIGWALLRTAGAALVPLLPALFLDPARLWLPTLLAVVPVLILAVLTSLAGLPSDGGGTWWQIGASRAVRQFGQYLLGALPASFALLDVDWRTLILSAAASAVATFVLYCLTVIPGSEVPYGTVGYTIDPYDDTQDGSTEGTGTLDSDAEPAAVEDA